MDIREIRADFPALQRMIDNKPLIYFDNAATTQKPRQVLDTIQAFYSTYNANIHRSPHRLGQEATALYDHARRNMARFIGADEPESHRRARAIDIALHASRLGGRQCMQHLYYMAIKACREKTEDDWIAHNISIWWDGIGGWRNEGTLSRTH